jgi:hypothetical protein
VVVDAGDVVVVVAVPDAGAPVEINVVGVLVVVTDSARPVLGASVVDGEVVAVSAEETVASVKGSEAGGE